MAYQIIADAPTESEAVTLLSQAGVGAPWGRAVPGATADFEYPSDFRRVVVTVPSEARDALDQAFPGSPWRPVAAGEEVLEAWRKMQRER